MLVLGLDPGIARTGYGLVEESPSGDLTCIEYGTVTTPAGQPMPSRLLSIDRDLGGLLSRLKPVVVAVEELFFCKNVTTALIVGQARGVAVLSAARAGLPVREYKPMEVKLSVTGYGHAPKTQVQEMVRLLLNLDHVPQPDDAADAVAVAVCHVHSVRLENVLAAQSG